MRMREGEFDGFAGTVRWRAWLPDGTAEAVVVIVHGVAEHGGRYGHVGQRLTAAGYAVYAPDHHGHGRSSGSRANVVSLDGVADDVDTMLDHATTAHPGVPRFLVGHSMGSLVTLHYLSRAPSKLAGVVLSAPPLDIPVVNPVLRAVSGLLDATAPNLGVLRLDSAQISRDPAVVADYDSDPLNYRGKLTVRTGTQILKTVTAVREALPRMTIPMLVLHGSADAIADPASAHFVADHTGSTDVTLKVYEGLYHEIFNEPEKEQVLDDVVGWLDAHR